MPDASAIQQQLIDVDDSVLIIIDVQDYFLNKYDRAKSRKLVANVVWLINVARHLDVPVVAMAEDIENTGTLTEKVRDALPEGVKIHNKDFFGLAGNPDLLAAVKATGRKTAICVGMETDVCVAQSAIGLNAHGFNVAAVRDAVASMDADEEVGLSRMRDAGVAVVSAKSLYYEWLRSVSKTMSLRNKAPELEAIQPTSLVL